MAENKEVSRAYPVDLLGNPVKAKTLVHVQFPKDSLICRVAEVMPVSLAEGMEIEGHIALLVQIPHRGQLPMCLVLKEPEEQRIEVIKEMPKQPAVVKM